MDFSKNYYRILGLPNSATEEDIKKAYRALAVKYHPDKNEESRVAKEKFIQIQEAYQILSNPLKRRQFDAVQRQQIYSPYSFAKETGGYSAEDSDRDIIRERKKAKDKYIWLKPVIFIVIAVITVWVIMNNG